MLDHLRAALAGLLATVGFSSPGYQGYGEGDYVLVSSAIGGTVEQLKVVRGQVVHKGDPLFDLEHVSEKAGVDLASAQMAQDEVAVRIAAINYQRDLKQIKMQAVSQAQADADNATLEQANAKLAASKANVTQAQWKLDQKTIVASADAMIVETIYRQGENVAANQPVVSLLPPENIRVRFFVPEKTLHEFPMGQGVHVNMDDGKEPLKAHVSFISPQAEYSPPQLYNRDNRSQLLYLLEATPDETPERVHPGQPVDVVADDRKD